MRLQFRLDQTWGQPDSTSHVRCEAFTTVTMKNVVFWGVALCSSGVNRRFGGTYPLLVSHVAYIPSHSVRFLYSWLFPTGGSVCSHLATRVLRSPIFLPWRWRRYVPPKRRLTQELHSATSSQYQSCLVVFLTQLFSRLDSVGGLIWSFTFYCARRDWLRVEHFCLSVTAWCGSSLMRFIKSVTGSGGWVGGTLARITEVPALILAPRLLPGTFTVFSVN
jgi:hypothetical protein